MDHDENGNVDIKELKRMIGSDHASKMELCDALNLTEADVDGAMSSILADAEHSVVDQEAFNAAWRKATRQPLCCTPPTSTNAGHQRYDQEKAWKIMNHLRQFAGGPMLALVAIAPVTNYWLPNQQSFGDYTKFLHFLGALAFFFVSPWLLRIWGSESFSRIPVIYSL